MPVLCYACACACALLCFTGMLTFSNRSERATAQGGARHPGGVYPQMRSAHGAFSTLFVRLVVCALWFVKLGTAAANMARGLWPAHWVPQASADTCAFAHPFVHPYVSYVFYLSTCMLCLSTCLSARMLKWIVSYAGGVYNMALITLMYASCVHTNDGDDWEDSTACIWRTTAPNIISYMVYPDHGICVPLEVR